MKEESQHEEGITPAVGTYFSGYSVLDIVEAIADKKAETVVKWIAARGIAPEKTLVIGAYLTGARVADRLAEESSVTVLDIYPHLKALPGPGVDFSSSIDEVLRDQWDLIIDTSGIGGISTEDIRRLGRPEAFLVECPCSDGSDAALKSVDKSAWRIRAAGADVSGMLFTGGIGSKTSGTMTLTVEVLRNSMEDALLREGVLYATATLGFFERILFRDLDADGFLRGLDKTALAVSSIGEVDCDDLIDTNLSEIEAGVLEQRGGHD